MHLIGTYGTLRRGHYNHGILENSNFVGVFHTGPGYYKIDVKPFPFLLKYEEGEGAELEVFEVDDETLARLDRLEGNPDFYVRTRITLADGTKAWVYLIPPERIGL